jgi:translation initiation factor 1
MSERRIVWDDDHRGRPPPRRPASARPAPGDGVVRIRRETGGRGGRTITRVVGLGLSVAELEALARDWKRSLGVGGAIDGFDIVIQGDCRDRLEALLAARGRTVKRAGG